MARHLGIRYLYREAPPAGPVPAARPNLSMLPEQLRKELVDAVVRLDSTRIREVIARVAEHDAATGEFLSRTAKRLAYSEILKAPEESNARAREET